MDRGNSSVEYDTTKAQNSSGSSAGVLAISSNSAGANVDSTVSSAAGLSNAGGSGGASAVGGDVAVAGDSSHTKSNNAAALAGGQTFSATEVDEDGYSLQPPKEVAWEESNENGMNKTSNY